MAASAVLVLALLVLAAAAARVADGYVAYNTSAGTVAGLLNVHLVPHSHDDVGWLKTVDQYFVGSNNSIQGACVMNTLDSVVDALDKDPCRKFVVAEQAFFQRWWVEKSPKIQAIVHKLVDSGQLEFINGGWCMHDEAATHYIDMIDQTTLGHRMIKQQFNKTPRAGWQIDPFGHSAVQSYLLGAEGAMLFGNKLEVNYSKYPTITPAPDAHEYSNSSLNRFNNNVVKNYRHCCAPTKMIHISTLPQDISEDAILDHVSEHGSVVGTKLFEVNGKRQALVLFETEEEATEALVSKHASALEGNTIRISFSQMQSL